MTTLNKPLTLAEVNYGINDRAAEWHGFVSSFGIGKVSMKATKKTFEARPHPYQKKR
jgi:hypothetical protein